MNIRRKQMIKIKNQKGITIVSLVMTVIILTILSTIAISTVKSSNNVGPYNKMIADINLLEDKLLIYYNKNGEIPVKENTEETINDTIYMQIDISKLENITLNYGTTNEDGDYYLINNSLKVYYKKGMEKSGETYHTK